MPSTPDIAPGLADFWAPAPETPEALAREVEGAASFASSRSAKYPFGVIYNGPWGDAPRWRLRGSAPECLRAASVWGASFSLQPDPMPLESRFCREVVSP